VVSQNNSVLRGPLNIQNLSTGYTRNRPDSVGLGPSGGGMLALIETVQELPKRGAKMPGKQPSPRPKWWRRIRCRHVPLSMWTKPQEMWDFRLFRLNPKDLSVLPLISSFDLKKGGKHGTDTHTNLQKVLICMWWWRILCFFLMGLCVLVCVSVVIAL
jgi:hypothetical protein